MHSARLMTLETHDASLIARLRCRRHAHNASLCRTVSRRAWQVYQMPNRKIEGGPLQGCQGQVRQVRNSGIAFDLSFPEPDPRQITRGRGAALWWNAVALLGLIALTVVLSRSF